jgi:hypothetical protein
VARLISNPRVRQWRVRWAGVILEVGPDRTAAVERLKTGHKHLAQAELLVRLGLPDVALLLAEAALVNGADAILRLHGYQVTSHAARFAYPRLPRTYTNNPGLLARIRTARNESQYEAAELVSSDFAVSTIHLAREALEAVGAAIV